MKISKRQLRRIIREEKTKLLRESVTDMTDVESVIEAATRSVGDIFVTKMNALWTEDPELLADVAVDQDNWEARVHDAVLTLDTGIEQAIQDAVQQAEMDLINGNY